MAGRLQHVGAVDAGGGDLDQDLIGARLQVRDLLPHKLTGGVGDDRIHGRQATTSGFGLFQRRCVA
ncbi:hypothetical protein MNVI_15060 [Mycobacterium noviomagense]|uniref:Uncharacterized protein n=1 Tax=Mycobacterium noviomagense TaxID=459858 RepID=A0A7I7PC55_9MYCO|nr:hypothetical protein MNVI_15060 [Mycobacterium noviomagense]